MTMMIIGDDTVASLFHNNAILAAFPFIKQAADRMKGVAKAAPCCNQTVLSDYNSIKASLAAMPAPNQDKFKKILGVDKVKVIWAGGNQIHTVIF
jgi:hypothetical protein